LRHVDEPHTSAVTLQVMTIGDLNPHRFHYGSVNIYMIVAVDSGHYLWLSRSPDERTGEGLRFADVAPFATEGWRWETTHPSFYLWYRDLCALLGTLTVFLVYLLGKRTNATVGLVAPGTLACLSVHVTNSSMVVPVAFFSSATVALSCAYAKSGRTLTLALPSLSQALRLPRSTTL
jgi:hypothetical protein